MSKLLQRMLPGSLARLCCWDPNGKCWLPSYCIFEMLQLLQGIGAEDEAADHTVGIFSGPESV